MEKKENVEKERSNLKYLFCVASGGIDDLYVFFSFSCPLKVRSFCSSSNGVRSFVRSMMIMNHRSKS